MIHYNVIIQDSKPITNPADRIRIGEFFKSCEEEDDVLVCMFSRSEIHKSDPNDTSMRRKLTAYFNAAVVKPMAAKMFISEHRFKLAMIVTCTGGQLPIEDMNAIELAEFIEKAVKWCEDNHGFRVQLAKITE